MSFTLNGFIVVCQHISPHSRRLDITVCEGGFVQSVITWASYIDRASLHLHELVNCRWAEDVTQQLDTLQLNVPSSSKVQRPDDAV